MSQRVLFASAPVTDAVRAAHPDFLGKTPKGAWFGVETEEALNLRRADSSVSLLYPTRAEYDAAMQGLDEAQRAEAVEWRLRAWTSRKQDEVLGDLYDKERILLAMIAKASLRNGNPGEIAKEIYGQDMALIDTILFKDRYDGWSEKTMLDVIFDAVNNLNRDVESLKAGLKDKFQGPDAELSQRRQALAASVQKALQRHGLHQGITPTGKVHVTFERGMYIVPKDPKLFEELAGEHKTIQKWKDGFVTVWEDWDFATLERVSKSHSWLYLGQDEFQYDFSMLTAPQRARRFAARAQAMGPEAVAEHLGSQQLFLGLMLKNAKPLLSAKEPALAEEVFKHGELEIESLRIALGTQGFWREGAASSAMATAESSLRDAEFWLGWAAASHWDGVGGDLQAIIAAKTKVVEALRTAGEM